MAPASETVNNLLNTLNEEDYKTAISFIEYLSEKGKKIKADQVNKLFEEFQNVIGSDKGWESEETMLQDMANFRRERLGL